MIQGFLYDKGFYYDIWKGSYTTSYISVYPPLTQPWGVIVEKYDRNAQGPRTTSQFDAHFKWGANPAGE